MIDGTLKIKFNDEEVILKIYKPLNRPFLCKDLCMFITMDVDDCGVECNPSITFLNSVIELPNLPIMPKWVKLKENTNKDIMYKDSYLKIKHSRGQK